MDVFRLTGSDELTTKMAKSAGLNEHFMKNAVKVSEGNPGAMNYLIAFHKKCDTLGFDCLLSCLAIKKITGSDFYSFVKERGFDDCFSELKQAGWL